MKDRIIVADGESGWDVLLFAEPGWKGECVVIASGLEEEDAEAVAEEFADKFERRVLN